MVGLYFLGVFAPHFAGFVDNEPVNNRLRCRETCNLLGSYFHQLNKQISIKWNSTLYVIMHNNEVYNKRIYNEFGE